jgi:hypothetical protein
MIFSENKLYEWFNKIYITNIGKIYIDYFNNLQIKLSKKNILYFSVSMKIKIIYINIFPFYKRHIFLAIWFITYFLTFLILEIHLLNFLYIILIFRSHCFFQQSIYSTIYWFRFHFIITLQKFTAGWTILSGEGDFTCSKESEEL